MGCFLSGSRHRHAEFDGAPHHTATMAGSHSEEGMKGFFTDIDVDLFRSDRKTIEVQKCIFQMWAFRKKPEMVAKLAELLRYALITALIFVCDVVLMVVCFSQQIC